MNATPRRAVVLVALWVIASPASYHARALAEDTPSRTRTHVTALASDADDGRLTGTVGERRAGDYIISQLQRIGAVPLAGTDYRLSFQFTAGARDGGSSITVSSSRPGAHTENFASRADIQALSLSDSSTISGPVVFAGSGIVVPESQDFGYDSYASLDVKDKIVLVLRY